MAISSPAKIYLNQYGVLEFFDKINWILGIAEVQRLRRAL